MDAKARLRVSKTMSLALRHDPGSFGLTLDPAGWVPIAHLVDALTRAGAEVDRDAVLEIVETSDKQRFAVSDDGTRIRANQGHSVPVDLGLAPLEPPAILFHGTSLDAWQSIQREGLVPMKRVHVHLSADRETAERVARRRQGPIVILRVDAASMHRAGKTFFRSENGVWLTESVPPMYLALA